MRTELARKIADRALAEGDTLTEIPGLRLYRRSVPTACASATYEPSLVVFLQGQKRINVGKTTYVCDGSNFLLTSVDLPVVSQVIAATEKEPLLGLVLKLEMPRSARFSRSRSFICARNPPTPAAWPSVSLRSSFSDACSRLVDLLDAPQDIPFLSGLIQREIIYRLLRSPQGKHLRAIATLGEQSHRTAKAVEWLRMNYAKPLRVEELATMARMGVSTLAPSIPFADRDEPSAISKAASAARRPGSACSTRVWMPPAPPSKSAMKAPASSTASTADSLASRRCGISKRVVLLSPQQLTLNRSERDAWRFACRFNRRIMQSPRPRNRRGNRVCIKQ